jgi:hypothetical protein
VLIKYQIEMKKLLFFTTILLFTGVIFGQTVISKKNLQLYKPAATLFLDDASHIGGIINFGNGDLTITHTSANLLNFAGGVVNFSVLPTIAGVSLSALYTSGNIDIGNNSLLFTGATSGAKIGATGARVVKGWFTDLEITNLPSINGTAITTTAAKLNYLTSATGTTGTASTNIVFSTLPTLVTPTITTSFTISGGDTTVTAVKGKTVFKTSDSTVYVCRSTTYRKKWYSMLH